MEIEKDLRTKIVATVGPACSSKENLLKLIDAGVSVFRLNFSHGTHDDHLQVIERITSINREENKHISILADLQGPKLRVGQIENNALVKDIHIFSDSKYTYNWITLPKTH